MSTNLPASSSSSLITISTCNLNQWALDFSSNVERIYQSCIIAKTQHKSTYRLGPELELCGYGCEDHYFEMDTFEHCWESLLELLERGATDGLLCDFGMPVLHHGVRYNCRVLCKDKKILLIRPKSVLADGGNYRESRYFTAYQNSSNKHEDFLLPMAMWDITGGHTVPFGMMSVELSDGIRIGCETCEELWAPDSPHVKMALQGVDIIGNGSGSHHELRKLNARLDLMIQATRKCGGVYLYANQRGCDGGRLYYDGCAMIVCNGEILAQADQFSLDDVQVISATVDLDDVRSYRAALPSFGVQASRLKLDADINSSPFLYYSDVFFNGNKHSDLTPVPTVGYARPKLHTPEEECCYGPACWLWDFLRRTNAAGFFLPLSGGADSSAVVTIVGAMCVMVTESIQSNSSPSNTVAQDLRRICQQSPSWIPGSSQEVAYHIIHTCYMASSNSSAATASRAKRLAEQIGCYHLSIQIDPLLRAALKVFHIAVNGAFTPKYASEGGSNTQDVALQNIQARMRMVMSYMLAQLLPWTRNKKSFLLVLGAANVDEGLRGYVTKYDCSSADLNPIGAISKLDLKNMLLWASDRFKWSVLTDVANAEPTAELRPISTSNNAATPNTLQEHSQSDEEDMGMTYQELSVFGKLRKVARCGPVSMMRKLLHTWNHLPPLEISTKIKRFFYYYSSNRHKMCTITPSYHAENYSPDDNRFDLRPFLYNTSWTRQFSVMDNMVEQLEDKQRKNELLTANLEVEDELRDKID